MAAVSNIDVDKLTYEIFSILENKFLFGYHDPDPNSKLTHDKPSKVRILSIDGAASTDGILAATSLVHLESSLRYKTGNPNARIADFFDVVAGSGVGGILAALLFTRGRDDDEFPIFTAEEALKFLVDNRRKICQSSRKGILQRVFRPETKVEKLIRKVFGESSLRDTLKAVLIPCYDLSTNAPFLFSRADALEMEGYDFKMRDVCVATSAESPVEMGSVDMRTRIVGVNRGGIAMNNPTAAAITHVLHNKVEYPLCNGVEDLLVLSLGNGEHHFGNLNCSPAGFLRIAGEGASDMVDQAVSMAFGQCRTSNYVRIQGNSSVAKEKEIEKMLAQKNVESVLFGGKKMVESTNLEKLELFAGQLIKEQDSKSILPTLSSSPRTSSATTLSTLSSSC